MKKVLSLLLACVFVLGIVTIFSGVASASAPVPCDPPPVSVPDADIMLLLGPALLGLGVFSRKFKRK